MRVLVFLALLGCGRIGYEPRVVVDDAASDSPDAPASCPPDMTRTAGLCIDVAERGNATWTDAKASCEALGRRLCADAEWALACTDAAGLVDMADDATSNWEWVAEEAGGVAQKRGLSACGDTSSHEIFVDPYDYRCCMDL